MPWTQDQPCRKAVIYTEKYTEETRTDIYVSSWIWSRDSRVSAGEDISFLRRRAHRDQKLYIDSNSVAWVHKRTIPTDRMTAVCRRS
jgi:hypothetical protein